MQPFIHYITRESYPSGRSDIEVLFGKYLPRLGLETTLVAKSEILDDSWPGGSLVKFSMFPFKFLFKIIYFGRRLSKAVQVRDKVMTAFLFVSVCRLRHVKFFYWMSWPYAEDDIAKYHYLSHQENLVKRCIYFTRGKLQELLLYNFILPCSDHIFVQSEEMYAWLHRDKGLPKASMTVVPMAVDRDEIAEVLGKISSQPKDLDESTTIVYCGVLNRHRIEIELISALAQICNSFPELDLLFVGSGQNENDEVWLRELLNDYGMGERYIITGWVSRQEALKLVSQSTVAINFLPRNLIFDTSSPTKTVEYAALGVPCVVTDSPDQQYVVENSSSGLAIPYSGQVLVDALSELLSNRRLREKLSENGREKIWSIRDYELVAQQLYLKYLELL